PANPEALKKGLVNLEAHIENMKKYGVPVVVAINKFLSDSEEELNLIADRCRELGADFATTEGFAKGGEGAKELAQKVVDACEKPADFHPIYELEGTIEDKLNVIARTIYGAEGVVLTAPAKKAAADIARLGGDTLPVCVAKTQYSLSDDPVKLGRPTDFTITVRDLRLSNGAGFVVALTGDIMTMPGLPKVPAAEKIDVDPNGVITGLF
ncbi:MAG: formate--tetrahydrofolate ligase, partial [Oscillospiraceae bacterium]|nr:formate--tetrahydrofolate ligase [Oscillospiraceae bacterium]